MVKSTKNVDFFIEIFGKIFINKFIFLNFKFVIIPWISSGEQLRIFLEYCNESKKIGNKKLQHIDLIQ